MTPDRTDPTPEESENGVLSDTGSLDTARIDFLGGATAQVDVQLPTDSEEPDDDDVIDDEVPFVIEIPADADTEFDAVDAEAVLARYDDDASGTVDAVDGESEDEVIAEIVGETAEHAIIDGDALDADVAPEAAPDTAPDRGEESSAVDESTDAAGEQLDDEAARADEAALAEAFVAAAAADVDDADVSDADADVRDADGAADAAAEVEVEPASAVADEAVSVYAVEMDEHGVPTPATQNETAEADTARASAAKDQVPAAAASVTTSTGSLPASRREAFHPTTVADRAVERVQPRPEVTMTSKRLGEFEADRETSDLLTPDRLLDPHHVVKSEPEGLWQQLVYSMSAHRINLGDGKRARARKELDRRIGAPLNGGARFVPVLSRKGGVGKTTVTTLLGQALADARDDRVIAIDANPDRGTLAERIARVSGKTVRDLVRVSGDVAGYNDLSNIVARDETRLDVLASDTDPRVSEAFSDLDYDTVASLAAHYYSVVLTDTGTGIVHSVMQATLARADQLVVVAGLSIDEAKLASETLTWLETNGYSEQVRGAIVVLNNARPGAPLVRPEELESHFRSRVRSVVRMPYDPHIAAGSAITFRDLQPATRLAARELAAAVIEGLRVLAHAA